MNDIRILAKSAMVLSQMKNKIDLGADGLEIQLLGELITDGTSTAPELEEAFPDLEEMLKLPVDSVHAPLCEYSDTVKFDVPPNIEVFMQPTFEDTFDRVCELANRYGQIQGKLVKVVVHTETDTSRRDEVFKYNFDKLLDFLYRMLNTYTSIDICIENVTPLDIKDNGEIVLRNGCGFENTEIVKAFRSKYPEFSNRIHTVLDTCHAEVAHQIMKLISRYDHKIKLSNYTVENFFKRNADTCGLIHMSQTIGNGNGEGKHGQPFDNTMESLEIINNYLNLYGQYGYTCPICLEVAEVDYDVSDGFDRSNKLLRMTIKIKQEIEERIEGEINGNH